MNPHDPLVCQAQKHEEEVEKSLNLLAINQRLPQEARATKSATREEEVKEQVLPVRVCSRTPAHDVNC